jgi:[acyl-carrier-protein] S-malonyltransferase
MRKALLFPGQGAQRVGMGRALAEAFPQTAGAVFQEADEVLGFGLSTLCFAGPDDVLAQTEVTQPALFATSVATLTVLNSLGLRAEVVVGHSVGEYAALVAAEAIDFRDALPVVRRRGELMAEAVAESPGAMAAIVGLEVDVVESICHEAASLGVVEPSNLNAPSQTVISGQVDAVVAAMDAATERGGKAIRLNVSAPFHCSMMGGVAEALKPAIDGMNVRKPRIPVIANVTAQPVTKPAEIRQALLDQIASPVRWTETMQYLLAGGHRSFLEVGPGKVLAGLVRAMDRSVHVLGVSLPDEVEQAIAE